MTRVSNKCGILFCPKTTRDSKALCRYVKLNVGQKMWIQLHRIVRKISTKALGICSGQTNRWKRQYDVYSMSDPSFRSHKILLREAYDDSDGAILRQANYVIGNFSYCVISFL